MTGELTLVTPMVDLVIKLHLLGFKIAPLDFAWAWDLDNKKRRCSSVSLFREVLDMQLELEFNVRECSVGLGGYLLRDTDGIDWYDCQNHRYTPYMPIKEFTFLDTIDKVYEYLPWQCNDLDELETQEN